MPSSQLAISTSSQYEPPHILSNEWFTSRGIIDSGFEENTGIRNRRLSDINEFAMAQQAVDRLKSESECDFRKCAGFVFTSSSLASHDDNSIEPTSEQHQLFHRWPEVREIALELKSYVNSRIPDDKVIGINWGCSGYVRALQLLGEMESQTPLSPGEFYLIVTSNRLSERVDYRQKTSALFGDFATACLISEVDDHNFQPRFVVKHATAATVATEGIGFYMNSSEGTTHPAAATNEGELGEKPCIEMNGRVVARYAGSLMRDEITESLEKFEFSQSLRPHVLLGHSPHRIANHLVQKLAEEGLLFTMHTSIADFGNISSSSIPHELLVSQDLDGIVYCPVSGAAIPGNPRLTKSLAILESTSTPTAAFTF